MPSEHRSGANGYQRAYAYDPAGNRLTEQNPVDGATTSVYDAANRLLTATSLSGITTYSYDHAGNRRTVAAPSGDVTTYTWNGQNQLVQVELPNEDVVTYVWAPVNKNSEERIALRDDGVDVQQLLWDNNNVLRETDDLGSVQAEYTYQPQPYGDLVSDRRETESNFYRFDTLGSTTGLTDAAGNVTDEYRYTAFGQELPGTGTTETPYKWVGQQGYRQDDATGLANLRARDYDPRTGQFVSPDPIGLESGDSNFYRYVGNSPADITDPSGNAPQWHHLLPQQLEHTFDKLEFKINQAHWGWVLDDIDHKKLHPLWNTEWKSWLSSQAQPITADDVVKQLDIMMKDPRFEPILKKGSQAIHSYSAWGKISAAGKAKLFSILKHVSAVMLPTILASGAANDACGAFSPILALSEEELRMQYQRALELLSDCNVQEAQKELFGNINDTPCFIDPNPKGLICNLLKRYMEANAMSISALLQLEKKIKEKWIADTASLNQELKAIGHGGCWK